MGRRRFLLWVAFLAILVVTTGLPCWGWDAVPPMGASFGVATVGYAPCPNTSSSLFGGKAGVSLSYLLVMARGRDEEFDASGASGAYSGIGATASYSTEGPGGSDVRLAGGFTGVDIGGGAATIKDDLRLWNITGDVGWPAQRGGGTGISVGPRIQWLQYVDTFSDLTAGTSTSRSLAMFGFGGHMTLTCPGLSSGLAYGNIVPVLHVAATVGFGSAMTYGWVEAFLQLYDSSLGVFDSRLKGEIGYSWLKFQEHKDEAAHARNYEVSIPSVRASLDF